MWLPCFYTPSVMNRAERNCNPLNIRRTSDKWQGQRDKQSDPEFVQFESSSYGIRAAVKILRTYQKKYGCRTVEDIVSRWAPPSENNTAGYIRYVCASMYVERDTPLNLEDNDTMSRLVKAMAFFESGCIIDSKFIRDIAEQTI